MNHYGRMAMAHWRAHRPIALEAMADPTSHFTRLGVEIEAAVTSMRDELLAARKPAIDEIEAASRQATTTAEELVLAEVLLESELATEDVDPATDRYRSLLASMNASLAATE